MTTETPDDIAERLRWESRLSRNGGVLFLPVLLDKAADEIEALRAQVAQYKEDAERYRWLVENTRITPEHWDGRWSIVVDSRCPKTHDKTGIDAAIDKARKA